LSKTNLRENYDPFFEITENYGHNFSYHRLHIMLLKVMTRLDPDPIYAEYVEKWKSYIGPYNFLKVSFMKYNALKKLGRV